MNIEKIKPIPKYILARIKNRDKQTYPTPNGHTRFYSYLTKIDGEICKITVAVRHRFTTWLYKQCAIHGVNSNNSYCKDMNFSYIAGYTVGWNREIEKKTVNWYERGIWEECEESSFDPYAPVLNKEMVLKTKKYKYCALNLYTGENAIKYLRMYDTYPQIEYVTKMRLHYYALSKTILQACKDKTFCKWLYRNADEIRSNYYDVNVIRHSYKSHKPLRELQDKANSIKRCIHEDSLKDVRPLFKGQLDILYNYITANTTPYSYRDYIDACIYLKIDLTEPKNRFPKDFNKWHDIRINQYNTAKIKDDAKKRKAFYEQFSAVAKKYLPLQKNNGDTFIMVIPKSPADLIREGNKLHHCVGKMGYDQKFVKEQTLIFFVRNKEKPKTPFVTIEYSLSNHKILQIHGIHNSTPSLDVLKFITKSWLPFANKKIKQIKEIA